MAVLEKYTKVKGDETGLRDLKLNTVIKNNQGQISVYLQSDDKFNVMVYNLMGKLIHHQSYLRHEVHLPRLTESSVYLVCVENRVGREVYKVVL
jgi:hypothetical protein